MEKTTLRWVLAHEPIEIFIRAANRFANVIGELTNGQVEIEILSLEEYAKKYHGVEKADTQYRYQLIEQLNAGELEMTQMYTTTLGTMFDKDMLAFDMPFMFKDHDHAARVLDGEIGQSIRANFAAKTNSQPLAFTYSGGFRVLPTNKAMSTLAELAGEKVRTGSEVSTETFKALGCEIVDGIVIEEVGSALGEGTITVGESTYPRLYGGEQYVSPSKTAHSVLNTEHSLFLTTILINKEIWAGFSEELQGHMLTAAQEAALEERKEALLDIEKNKARLAQDGVEVVYFSDADMDEFRARTASVYDTLDHIFSEGLINKMKNA